MAKRFEFVRIKSKLTGEDMGTWYFRAKTLEQVQLHTEMVLRPAMQGGLDKFNNKYVSAINIASKKHWEGYDKQDVIDMALMHSTDDVERAIRNVDLMFHARNRPLSILETASNMLQDAYKARVDTLRKYGECFLANGVQQFGYNDTHFEISEVVFSDEFQYPNTVMATEKDVRIIRWDGGTHYYAKVGRLDVVDGRGNQKWGTEAEAKAAAIEFIKREKVYV